MTKENVAWTSGKGRASDVARMQDDRNMVVYRKDGHPIWDTKTG